MYGWDSLTDDDRRRNLQELDRAARSRPLDETEQGWILRPVEPRKKKYVDLGCILVSRKICLWALGTIVVTAFLVGSVTTNFKTVPRNHHKPPPPDNYTLALHKALKFFNAQKSGKLPRHNNVSWRGNSGLQDGHGDAGIFYFYKDLVGGYYYAGDDIKLNFPMAYSMTMLSWSAVEYSAKYKAAGEFVHVKELIKWGTDYLLKTFDSTALTIDNLVSQVGSDPNDHYCWMRPEDMDYKRPVSLCYTACPQLAAEMAAALASASIVFKDNEEYSKKLVHGAKTVYQFGRDRIGRHSAGAARSARFNNSSMYWDKVIWGGTWLYYATGDVTYLELITNPAMAKHAGAFSGGPFYGVFSWDNKLAGAQLLLTRFRLFLSPGYPYEGILSTFHKQTDRIMCSYLPYFNKFNRTKGGLIELNHGVPQPLQYAANAAFLATLFSDYLDAAFTPGWYCGPDFFRTNVLREFARSQIDYILGKNPRNMSYLVGFGPKYPTHLHHRGASIPKNKVKYNCTGGWKWRNSKKPNPNTIEGAIVGGPDKHDGFRDVRTNYKYTEPTLAGNAGLVAALVPLSGEEDRSRGGPLRTSSAIDKKTIFSAVPPLFPTQPPPPAPWAP